MVRVVSIAVCVVSIGMCVVIYQNPGPEYKLDRIDRQLLRSTFVLFIYLIVVFTSFKEQSVI